MIILLAHPVLVEEQGEDLAGLELAAPELTALRDRILDLAHDEIGPGAALRATLAEAGFAATLSRLDKSGAGSMWYAQPDAAPQDAGAVLRQALTLHHKTQALHRDLLSAETALASDASEPNMARMRDIQEQLSALVGTEAAVEGFGALSGRSSQSL